MHLTLKHVDLKSNGSIIDFTQYANNVKPL